MTGPRGSAILNTEMGQANTRRSGRYMIAAITQGREVRRESEGSDDVSDRSVQYIRPLQR